MLAIVIRDTHESSSNNEELIARVREINLPSPEKIQLIHFLERNSISQEAGEAFLADLEKQLERPDVFEMECLPSSDESRNERLQAEVDTIFYRLKLFMPAKTLSNAEDGQWALRI